MTPPAMTMMSAHAQLSEFRNHLRDQGFVTPCQGGNPQNVYIILNGLPGRFSRSLKERTDVHVKSHICITGTDHFGPPVVTVLSHFGDHDPGLTACPGGEFTGQFSGFQKRLSSPDSEEYTPEIERITALYLPDTFFDG
jgi:hypothetical protein